MGGALPEKCQLAKILRSVKAYSYSVLTLPNIANMSAGDIVPGVDIVTLSGSSITQ